MRHTPIQDKKRAHALSQAVSGHILCLQGQSRSGARVKNDESMWSTYIRDGEGRVDVDTFAWLFARQSHSHASHMTGFNQL